MARINKYLIENTSLKLLSQIYRFLLKYYFNICLPFDGVLHPTKNHGHYAIIKSFFKITMMTTDY